MPACAPGSPVASLTRLRRGASLFALGVLLLSAAGARAQELPVAPSSKPMIEPNPVPAPGTVPSPAAEAPLVPAMPPGQGEETTPSEPAYANGWQYIIIHHSASSSGNAAAFDRMHRGKGWDGVAYHFVITNGHGGPDGAVQITSRWWNQKHGAHAGALPYAPQADERNCYNEFGIGICLVGNLEQQGPTSAQLSTLASLVNHLRLKYGIAPEHIMGHRHVKSTACPGRNFPWASLFARMNLPRPTHLTQHTPTGTIDRCPWCLKHEAVASSRLPSPRAPASQLPPRTLLLRTDSSMPVGTGP